VEGWVHDVVVVVVVVVVGDGGKVEAGAVKNRFVECMRRWLVGSVEVMAAEDGGVECICRCECESLSVEEDGE